MLTKQTLQNLLSNFINYLAQANSSRSTVSNYSSDLRRILSYLPENSEITTEHFNQVLAVLERTFSPSTLRRFSFSIKAFQNWLATQGYAFKASASVLTAPVTASPITTTQTPQNVSNTTSHVLLDEYTNELLKEGSSTNSIRSQRSDIASFFKWLRPNASNLDTKTVASVRPFDINRYISALKFHKIPEASVNRYIYSLKNFFNFTREKTVFIDNPVKFDAYSKPKHGFLQRFKIPKPRWWHAYRGHPISDYLNWTALAVITLLIGLGVFQQFFVPKQPVINLTELQKGLVLAATPPRILSFQGRLTNTSGSPVTGATNVVFKIYDDRTLGGGHLKWTSKTWSVTPDQNGIFSVCLGGQDTTDDCLLDAIADTVIPSSLFSDNAALYLGITVGADSEATPRQRIASSTYALNSDSLDGLDSTSFLRTDASSNLLTGNTLQLNDGSTFTVNSSTIGIGNASGDALTVNAASTFNTDIDLTFAGTENLAMTSDLAGTVNVMSLVATPSSTSGTTAGLFLQQANSANTNGLDAAVKIDNADSDLAVTDAINIANTGGGGYTNYISAPNFTVTGAGAGTFGSTLTVSGSFVSVGSTAAAAGALRLPNNNTISWRNAANSADLTLKADGSDRFAFSGTATGTSASTLVLPIKTDSGDPTTIQTNGSLYYNSNTNKFRCYEASAWVNCIGSGSGSLFTDAGSFTYLTSTTDDLVLGGSTAAGGSLYFQLTDGGSPVTSTLFLGTDESKNGKIVLYSSGVGITDASLATNATGDLNIQAPSGTVNIGTINSDITLDAGTGNIIANLSSTGDFFIKDNGTSFVTFDDTSHTIFDYPSGTGTGVTVNGASLTTGILQQDAFTSSLTATGTTTGLQIAATVAGTNAANSYTINSLDLAAIAGSCGGSVTLCRDNALNIGGQQLAAANQTSTAINIADQYNATGPHYGICFDCDGT